MIRVTIEIVPDGDLIRRRTLSIIDVSNIAGTDVLGDYYVERMNMSTKERYGFHLIEHRRASGM